MATTVEAVAGLESSNRWSLTARGRRPDPQGGHVAGREGGAQRAVVGVEVVEHALDLEAGGIDEVAAAVLGIDRDLPLEGLAHLGETARRDVERRVAGDVRELLPDRGGEAGRIVGQRDRRAAGDAGGIEGEAAVGVVVEGDVPTGRHGARVPGDGVRRDPIGLSPADVPLGGSVGADGQHVSGGVVGEEDLDAGLRHREGDVGAVERAVGAVVLVPALIDRDLRLVVAGRDRGGREGIDPVAVRILEPGAQALRLPVPRAAQEVLVAAGRRGDHGVPVAGHPVRRVIVIELDRRRRGEVEAEVAAPRLRVGAVVDVPRVVEGRLVLVASGRDVEGPLPDAVGRVVGQVGVGAVGLPVVGAAELGLEAAGDGDARRLGRAAAGTGGDGEDVGRRVVAEHGLGAVGGDGELDVGPVRGAAGAVVLIPALVDRDLGLVAAGRDRAGGEAVDAVAVRVLEPGAQAVGLPVPRAAQEVLEAAGRDGDHRVLVAGDPVGLVRVVELDAGGGAEVEREIAAVVLGVVAVVLGPGVVEGRLVLIAAGRDVEGSLPDVVHRIEGQVGGGAVRHPVVGTAELGLQVAGDSHELRGGRIREDRGRDQG
jgi:hypothetical protein